MTRRFLFALLFPLLLVPAASADPMPTPRPACSLDAASGKTLCCKVCRKGKACGDACIAKNKSCNKAGGCACNG